VANAVRRGRVAVRWLLKVEVLAAHVRWRDLSFVEHVANLARGQRARYAEAKVTNVTRLKPPRDEVSRVDDGELVLNREELRILRRTCGTEPSSATGEPSNPPKRVRLSR